MNTDPSSFKTLHQPPLPMQQEPTIDVQLRRIWGASHMPFAKTVRTPFEYPAFQQLIHRLLQMIQVRSSGVLCGDNGIGKSQLLACALKQLPPKAYKILHLHHTSLSGNELLRVLCRQLEQTPAFRRSDTLRLIANNWVQSDGRFPIVVIDEAQNLSANALEELRLLSCAQLDGCTDFVLLLCGDLELMQTLRMRINKPLLSRLGFQLQMQPLDPSTLQAYIDHRFKEAGFGSDILEDGARTLAVQISGGILRHTDTLLRAALQCAALDNQPTITTQHLQKALDILPWLAQRRDMSVLPTP
ncbi:AAA family ATPase [Arthrospira platensis SPKY2]